MRQRCKKCGAKSFSELCFKCKPNHSLSSGNFIKSKSKAEETNKMHEFFLSIWNKREHRSEISNASLGNEPLSIFFHHILLRQKFPEAAFDEECVILLTGDEHASVHQNSKKYPEINKIRILLLEKYGK